MTDQLDVVEVGGNKYQVIKTGRAQAEQVLLISRWISKHGIKAIQSLQAENQKLEISNSFDFLDKVIEALSADALVDLFIAVVGCSKEDGELYFDIAILIDVLVQTYERQPTVRRLVERFFSTPDSEGGNSGESSTTSEPPTDGQTAKS